MKWKLSEIYGVLIDFACVENYVSNSPGPKCYMITSFGNAAALSGENK